ncbi:hypothetical protein OPT61_g7491 [Boeremia exigua]|uniref:Uncharacterized protein n=1 Tax=Boeremia exigua TaxID=749465 RepID=A0ACC2I2J8_9PLEO|nr:hypothetical protein OPT61_g7491 [Boeremia exigua]
MVICGGGALRVDMLMPARRWQFGQVVLAELARATRPFKPHSTPSLALQLNAPPNSIPRLTDAGRAAETNHTMPTLAAYCCNASKGASRCS